MSRHDLSSTIIATVVILAYRVGVAFVFTIGALELFGETGGWIIASVVYIFSFLGWVANIVNGVEN